MGLLRRVKGVGHKVAASYLKVASAPVKYAGGATAHLLGSKASYADFNRGLHTLAPGGPKPHFDRGAQAAEAFLAKAPVVLVDRAGDLAKDAVEEVAEDAGGLLNKGLSGLFTAGGLPLLIVAAVALFLLFSGVSGNAGGKSFGVKIG